MVWVLLSVIGFVTLLLSFFLLYSGNRKYDYQFDFGGVILFAGLWVLFIGLFFLTGGNRLILNCNYFVAMMMIGFLLSFSMRISGSNSKSVFIAQASGSLISSFFLLNLSRDASYIIKETVFLHNKVTDIINIQGYTLYSIFFIILFVGTLFFMYKSYSNKESDSFNITHFSAIFRSTIITGLVGLFTNLYLPAIGQYSYIWVSPSMVLSVCFFVAINTFKYKVFDIKFVAARSLAYFLLIFTLASTYGILIFAISSQFFKGDSISIAQQAVYITLAVFLAFTFQPLKRFFDRITNKIFFRDYYDIREKLSEFSKAVSLENNLGKLLSDSLAIISNTIKPIGLKAVVLDAENDKIFAQKSYGSFAENIPFEDISLIKIKNSVLTAGDVDEPDLSNLMRKNNIDMIVKLRSAEALVGYIFIKQKSSGSSFSLQDIEFLEISSKQLSIAIDNARHVEEIADFNETLQKEIQNATKKLEKTNNKLIKLDEAKDEFVSMASHQLRTPLTTVKGYLSMLEDGDAGKLTKDQKKFVGEAYTSAQRMVYLISDLLNVSRINTGKFVINDQSIQLNEVIESEVQQMLRSAKSKSINLTYDKPTKFSVLNLDEQKIRQVIMNFIDNAIYYTPDKGEIKVSLTETRDSIEFKVTDNGIGVPSAQQHELFNKFFRASNAKNIRPDGTGLGLFMARKVIAAEGGSIIFRSKEDKGSTFGFVFPKHSVLAEKKK